MLSPIEKQKVLEYQKSPWTRQWDWLDEEKKRKPILTKLTKQKEKNEEDIKKKTSEISKLKEKLKQFQEKK